MIPIQQFMPEVVARAVRKAPLTSEKVAFAWRMAVGPALANATSVELRDGTLRVAARDRRWQREVRRAAPLILERLAAILGDAATELTVTAPAATPPSAGGSGTARHRR